jgi:acyl-CoA reductase-like NAD-dependent aldehyde dehydrogenase
MATWTKLQSGDWGISITGTVTVGQAITVKSKSGEVKTVTIARVISAAGGKSLCAISASAKSAPKLASQGLHRGKCSGCGRATSKMYGSDHECYDCWQHNR